MKSLIILNEIVNELIEGTLEIPTIPNTKNFWHGGNLDTYDSIITQKNGRYEYGAGLYCTTHYDTAKKYAKGSRKLYLVSIEEGNDINDMYLELDKIKSFIMQYVSSSKRNEIYDIIKSHVKDNKVKAFIFNNVLINHKVLKPVNTVHLRDFLIQNNIDYELVDNPFGWGETMIVLYNMNKIKNVIRVNPKDKIEIYNLT
jgi:hypothetical protein